MIRRERVRNIGLIAHIDAGKTTVTERILFFTKKEHKIGEVHDGTAKMDWLEEERERGITITAACTTVFWKDVCINIVDTPGHVDFTAEVERSLRILDGAVVVFSGVEGVEAQSETVWHQSERYGVPKICFVNKLDRVGADFDRVVEEIREHFDVTPLPLQIPVYAGGEFTGVVDVLAGEKYHIPEDPTADLRVERMTEEEEEVWRERREHLVEIVAEHDDRILELYLDGKELPLSRLKAVIKKLTLGSRFAPVLCGAALKNRGVRFLLDAVVDYLPSVADLKPVEGIDRVTGGKVTRRQNVHEPFSALAFKVQNDLHGGITYLRIYSGTLKAKGRIYNSTRDRIEKISQIYRMHASHREIIPEAVAGDIVAVSGLKFTVTGDTLTAKDDTIVYEIPRFPETVISMSIEPSTSTDEERMENVLKLIARDDPTFSYRMDPETGQMLISGMGELHLEVIVHRIMREYKVNVRVGKPRVSYRETVKGRGTGEVEFETQVGDRVRYARVTLSVEHMDGEGFAFENALPPMTGVPREFVEAVREGIEDSLEAGVLMGYPVIQVKAVLTDARARTPESDADAFRTAGSMAFRKALSEAEPVLLEPFMRVVVVVPPECVGEIISFFNTARGEIYSSDVKRGGSGEGEMRIMEATAPLEELFGFSSTFRTITQGRGYFSMEPKEYRPIPEDRLRRMDIF